MKIPDVYVRYKCYSQIFVHKKKDAPSSTSNLNKIYVNDRYPVPHLSKSLCSCTTDPKTKCINSIPQFRYKSQLLPLHNIECLRTGNLDFYGCPAVSAHSLLPICTNREHALANANTSSSPVNIELLPTTSVDKPYF